MSIDWDLVTKIAAPLLTLFLGRYLEKNAGAKLIAYFAHVSTFHIRSATPPTQVYAHSIIVRNTGKRTSNNVRINHPILPEFHMFPDISHSVLDLPNGSKEILIPKLVPGEQITVSYLYFPPITAGQIHAGIKSDDGFAKHIDVALQPQLNKWQNALIYFLFFIGVCTTAYLLIEMIRHYFIS